MNVVCLCPTYSARPAVLVGNSIACFEAQTHSNATLIVYDDTGHFRPTSGKRWRLESEAKRQPTLSEKYNRMVEMAGDVDAFIVWEDDDIYLPWHVEACVEALKQGPWVHPERVLSLYPGEPIEEPAAGRFHASLAFRRGALAEIGGWPATARGDFDQQLIRNLGNRFGPPADPCKHFPPSYVFRWASTGCPHGQSFMRSAADEEWYERAAEQEPASGPREVVPAMDRETSEIVTRFQKSCQ